MIVPDVNLLLYAYFTRFAEHPRARAWWETALAGSEEVGVPGPALFGFIRIATNGRVLDNAMSADEAALCVEAWFEQPHVRFLQPGPRHLEIAFGFLRSLGTAANLTTDAQLAAYAVENQAELHSNDTDFARFPQLRWINPLEKRARRT